MKIIVKRYRLLIGIVILSFMLCPIEVIANNKIQTEILTIEWGIESLNDGDIVPYLTNYCFQAYLMENESVIKEASYSYTGESDGGEKYDGSDLPIKPGNYSVLAFDPDHPENELQRHFRIQKGVLIGIFFENSIYNGKPQVLAEIKPLVGGVELNPDRLGIQYQGMLENGEIYKESNVPPSETGNYKVDFSYKGDDYYEQYQETKEVKIKPIELNNTEFMIGHPISKVYDGTVSVLSDNIKGLSHPQILEQDQTDINYTFGKAEFESKDVVPMYKNKVILTDVILSGEKAYNYELIHKSEEEKKINQTEKKDQMSTEIELTGEITPKPMDVKLIGEDKVYDGSSELIQFTFSINEEDLIKGERLKVDVTDAFMPWYGKVTEMQKDVGEYFVWASTGMYFVGNDKTNDTNYVIKNQLISSINTYKIMPAKIILKSHYVSKFQGEKDPILDYSVFRITDENQEILGLYGSDILYGELERDPGEAIGNYSVYLGTLQNPNYRIAIENGENKFEILKQENNALTDKNIRSGRRNADSTYVEETEKNNMGLWSTIVISLIAIVGGYFFTKMSDV
jgi:hypothetical protein